MGNPQYTTKGPTSQWPDDVTSALRQTATFRNRRDLAVVPLEGGLTNRNYRIDVDGESYVLRIAGTGVEELLIDRGRELAAARAAAAAGVAPAVIEAAPDHTLLVTQFLHGKQPTAEEVRKDETLRRVAVALRRYHEFPPPPGLGTFSGFAVVRHYHHRAQAKGAHLPVELERAMEMLQWIEDELGGDLPSCLCHNDLLLGNFIDDGQALWIIDWEYAGLGDRFFDLGNFAAHNQFGEAEERRLLEHYFGTARDEDLYRVRLMRLMSDLREAMWGYLQSVTSTLYEPQYFLNYGQQFLNRFLAGMAANGLTG